MGKQSDQVTAAVELSFDGNRVELEIPVTTRAVRPIDLLPLFQGLADDFTKLAADAAEEQGFRISCRKGCGACCRQLVPVTHTEARHLRRLMNSLPEPRRTQIIARFEGAREQLREEGILEKVLAPQDCSDADLRKLVLDYFHLGIPCPFLEEERCSIRHDRPLVCREYLVTSPAGNCARPTADTIEKLKVPSKVWIAVARIEEDPSARFIPFVSLIVAPSWAEANPDDRPPRPGPEILREFMGRFTAKEIPRVPEF